MKEISKKEMRLSLLSPNNFIEGRNLNNLKSFHHNSTKNGNNKNNISNEDDSLSINFYTKKKMIKSKGIADINRKLEFKNTLQYGNYFLRSKNEDNYYSEGNNNTINKLINKQKLNELHENFKNLINPKKTEKTEIILKKVRFHDFIEKKKKLNKENIKSKTKNRNDDSSKDNVEFNYYLPVRGILFQKKINNNFYNRNKKQNMLNVESPKFFKNKTPKMTSNIQLKEKKIKFQSSLPLINEKDYKNKTQNIFFNKNILKKQKKFSNSEINIKMKSNKNINLNNIHGYRKLINFNMISKPGSYFGKTKNNQDDYFIISHLGNCEEIKVFGIFDGHGENGDFLSQEIKEYFKNYFIDLFNSNTINDDVEYFKNNFVIKSINNKQDFSNNYNYISTKFKSKKINFNSSEEIKLENLSNKLKEKSDKIKYIYNKITSNNYSEIFISHKKLDEILHLKYSNSDFCHLTGSTSLIIFIFNTKNFNKIISSNLGDSKIILISQNNTIKELNTLHTPNNPEEKNRIINNGGVINRLNVGPLRIWYKNKKYPGLSITRSFGDFESDSLGVLSVPDVKEYDLDEEQTKILIFGTDGVWKFMTNEQIMNTALPYYEQNDVEGATQKIKEIANQLWNIKNPKGVADITVFVLFFK